MSKFSTIFDNEETTPKQKLGALSELVSKVRAKYGNESAEVEVPEVNTTDGIMGIEYLSDEDKLTIAKQAIHSITAEAIEAAQNNNLVVLDRVIESGIATSDILSSINIQVESEYL